jgi:hypothetical protein
MLNELLFFGYISVFNVMVLSMLSDIEITNHQGITEIKQSMPNSTLAVLLLFAFVLEIIGFHKIPASKNHKATILLLTSIPRLFLFWEVSRILMVSFTHKITTGGSILLFFMVPVLLLISFVAFGMKSEPKPISENNQKWNFQFLYVLPMYCLWFTLFEKVYLPDLWGGDWFVFIGLYSVFMYFPLRLPYIIIQIKSKTMSKWKIAMLTIQPVLVYFMVYKSLV